MQSDQPSIEQKNTEQTQRTAELWIREHSVGIHDSQQAVLTQLQDLVEDGYFDALDVHTWNSCVAVAVDECPNESAKEVLNSIHEFEAWIDQNDCTFPGFQRRTQATLSVNTTREVVVPPFLCLAIYEDETLSEVVPHSKSEGHLTVSEWLRSFTSDDGSQLSAQSTNKQTSPNEK